MKRFFILILVLICFIHKGQASEKMKLNLEQALEIAVKNNPKLQAMLKERDIAAANLTIAEARLNPTLISDNGLAEKTYRLGIEKTIELGSKRAKRIQLAERNRERVEADISLAKLNLRTELRLAYTELFILQEKHKCFEDIVKLTDTLYNIANKREQSGDISKLDTLQVEMSKLNAHNEVENIKTQATEAQNKLNSLLQQNLDTELYLENPSQINLIAQDLKKCEDFHKILSDKESQLSLSIISKQEIEKDFLSKLFKTAFHNRPEMKQNQSSQESNQKELELAKANRIPNLSITMGPDLVTNPSGANSTGVFIIGNMQLPLLYRNEGQIQAAQARTNKLLQEKESLKNQIELEVANAYNRINTNQAKLKRFEEDLSPTAELINEKSLRCFAEGKCPVIIAINAGQSLINTRINHLNTVADYQNSISELERTIGEGL